MLSASVQNLVLVALVCTTALASTGTTSYRNSTSSLLSHSLGSTRSLSSSAVQTGGSSTHPGISSTTVANHGIGDFVASGLGLLGKISTEASSTLSATKVFLNATSTRSPVGTGAASVGSAGASPLSANVSGAYCWQQWSSYYSASALLTSQTLFVPGVGSNTNTNTNFSTLSGHFSTATTVTEFNGAFPVSTYETTLVESTSLSPIATWTTTQTFTGESKETIPPSATITPPPCVLPSVVPQCQSSWSNWIHHKFASMPYPNDGPPGCPEYGTTLPASCAAPLSAWSSSVSAWTNIEFGPAPACSAAAVTGSMCSSLVSSWMSMQASFNPATDGISGGVLTWATLNSTETQIYTWPTSKAFAPSCTLGCQSCAIQGGTVQLIYWPPATSTYGSDGRYTALSSNDTGVVTAETLGTTFTSPTVYVSFDSLWARDSCTPFGKTHAGSIVAITDTADLKSLYGYNYLNYAQSSVSQEKFVSCIIAWRVAQCSQGTTFQKMSNFDRSSR